ncbi:MAG: hypothetical protein WBL50_10650 [Candidatus Acidiferrum sp.]
MTVQDMCFIELDDLSKTVSDREYLIVALNSIYWDEINRSEQSVSDIYDDWRRAHLQIKD